MALLSDSEVGQGLQRLEGWQKSGTAIQRTLQFPDFKTAMRFVNQIADAADRANHHPDIDIRYNKVTLLLVSHDSGGVTERDLRLADEINKLAKG